jgi:hypothetical protein
MRGAGAARRQSQRQATRQQRAGDRGSAAARTHLSPPRSPCWANRCKTCPVHHLGETPPCRVANSKLNLKSRVLLAGTRSAKGPAPSDTQLKTGPGGAARWRQLKQRRRTHSSLSALGATSCEWAHTTHKRVTSERRQTRQPVRYYACSGRQGPGARKAESGSNALIL